MRQKTKRTLDNTGVLEQRYNRALVCAQLKAVFAYDKDEDLYADQDKVMQAWQETSKVIGDRPRFFNVKDALSLDRDLIVLTSSHSTYWTDGHEYQVFTLTYKSFVNFGLPMCKHLVELLGGPNLICRVIANDGINGLIKMLEESFALAQEYVDKDRITNNIKILKQFKGAIVV